jgi:hypothetical protein
MCVVVFIRVRARARACACVYACLCERTCVGSCVSIVHFRACVRHGALRALACGIYSSVRAARCGCARGCGSVRPAGCRARSAAGVTWTCRTANAQWAARYWHTSVVDAAGAIYVIGGTTGAGFSTDYQDVWASTDGGARAGLGQGGDRGVLEWGTQGGYWGGYPTGTKGYEGVVMEFPWGYQVVLWVLDGVLGDRLLTGVLEVYSRGYSSEYSRGTIEYSRRSIPRCLGHSKRLRRGMLEGVLRGGLSRYSGGTQGNLGVVGSTLGYPLTGLHARVFAELFGFGAKRRRSVQL